MSANAERGVREASEEPFVSVIVPCRNECDFIAECLDSILATSYPLDRFEIVVIDGMSDDGTRSILDRYASEHDNVRVLDNPARITPTALNIGVRDSHGDVIVRMDAHNVYPPEYVPRLVGWLERSGADNVGGLWRTEPGDDTDLARAIAVALSHPLGVGNAYFRIGVEEPRWVDTVPFGCYRRDVFDRIGLFDEDLVRNQDDEFNARLLQQGGRILLVPEVFSTYYARPSLTKLSRMYYQYGLFKPLAIRKLGGIPTVRQLVPALFVVALGISALLAPWLVLARVALAAIVIAYGSAVVLAALVETLRRGVGVASPLLLVFPILHLSYGIGFLRGVIDVLLFVRRRGSGAVPLSR